MRVFSSIIAIILVLGVSADVQVQSVYTNAEEQFSPQATLTFTSGNTPQGSVISVNDTITYQTMAGFGAALTDSTGYLLSNLNSTAYWTVLNSLFNATSGIGISYIRLQISASDFALTNYTYDNQPEGQTDPSLQDFSIAHDKPYIIPLIQSIKEINPKLKIIASPWSPPAWMKTTDTMLGTAPDGTVSYLSETYHESYANYFVKFIQAYEMQGITIDALTIQNEPLYGPTGYPGCVIDQYAASAFINDHLAPAFLENNIQTKVFVYDHNWDREDYPAYVYKNLNIYSKQVVGGAAFHCYAGNVTNQSVFHNSYPDAHIYQTECSGGDWIDGFTNVLDNDMKTILIEAINNWAEVSLKWNIALDQNKGPQNGGCNTCRGLVTIHTDSGEIDYTVDYYSIGIFSKYVRPGATRIQVQTSDAANFLATGFVNPDGSRVVIVYNQDTVFHQFSLTWNNSWIQATLPAQTVAAFTWNSEIDFDIIQ